MAIELKTKVDKTSYALGLDIGSSFRNLPVEINPEAAVAGLMDIFKGEKPQLSQQDFMEVMKEFQKEMRAAAEKAQQQISDNNKKQEVEFMTVNRKNEGVKETASGLQYKVITEGKGEKPSKTSVVKVHYTGTLPDGTIFDSSEQRGEPATFPLNQVIAGWTEALQLMSVGSRYILYVPSALAYGSRGAGELIGPDQMLIFEVELLDIVQ